MFYVLGFLHLLVYSLFRGSNNCVSGSVTKLQWTMSLVIGIPFIIGPVANALCKFYSIRKVVNCGAMFTCAAFFAAWFATSVKHLYIFFAIAGIGFGLAYQPSLIILAYYFERRLARANGISAAGNGIGNFAFPPLLQFLIDQYGWNGAVLILSGIVANIAVFGSLYRLSDLELSNRRGLRSRNGNEGSTHSFQVVTKSKTNASELELSEGSCTDSITRGQTQNAQSGQEPNKRSMEIQTAECSSVNVNSEQESTNITESRPVERCCAGRGETINKYSGIVTDIMAAFNFYLLLDARFIPLFLANCPYGFGYSLVMAYLPAMAIQSGISDIKAALLLSILGICSLIARFTHGFLIDSKLLSASMLTALSFLLSAIATALFPVSNNYNIFAFLSVLIGIGLGIFNSTVPVVAKEYVGVRRVSGAVGLLMLSTGTGVFLGLFLTGILYDMTGSYTIAFLLAGAAFLISSILLFVDPLIRHFLNT